MANGSSLGAALMAHLRESGGGTGRMKSYTAQGWHAQISKLTAMGDRGSQAAEKAGLDVTARTLTGWLSESTTPSAANRAKIAEAYGILGGRFPGGVKGETLKISGEVGYGGDVRDRGSKGSAPLRVDGSKGNWERIEEAWNDGTLTESMLEDLYAEDVIGEDIGDAYEWSFPGGSYAVSA